MTTSRSPLSILRRQADKVAQILKAAERGEPFENDPGGKIASARSTKEKVKFALAMDDKILSIEMPWAMIRSMSERDISTFVLAEMRKQRETVH